MARIGVEIMKSGISVARGVIATFAFTLAGVANAGTVVVKSDLFSAATVNDFYNAYGGNRSTITTQAVSSIDFKGVDLFWSIQPSNGYSAADLLAMSNYLAGGGRIAFLGENGGTAAKQNANINAALTALGATMLIGSGTVDSGTQTASKVSGQIKDMSLTAGVKNFQYGAFAPIFLWDSAQAIVQGKNLSSALMAYQGIGGGGIFVVTDQNIWDGSRTLWSNHDNEMLLGRMAAAQVTAPVPESATWAMMIAGFGAIGYVLRRRRAMHRRVTYA